MDNFYKVQISDSVRCEDNCTCLVSPEVALLLGLSDGDCVRVQFVPPRVAAQNQLLSDLLRIKTCSRVEKNCVSLASATCGLTSCYLSLAKDIPVLDSVDFKVTEAAGMRRTLLVGYFADLSFR